MTSQISYPRISYHGGHSSDLCVHAPGSDTKSDLIEAYIAGGFSHFGVVEHLQPPADQFLFPEEIQAGFTAQALTERLDRFFAADRPGLARDIARRYGGRIQMAIGIETEYYGAEPNIWLRNMIRRYRPDFIVASVHHVRGIPIDYSAEVFNRAVEVCGGLDQLAVEYFRAIRAQIAFLKEFFVPVVVGHLDLIKLFAPQFRLSLLIEDEIRAVITEAAAAGFVFEVNARAFKKGLTEPYPSAAILKLISACGGMITFGDDAHAAAEVGMNLDRAAQFAAARFDEVVAFEWSGGRLEPVRFPIRKVF